MSMSQGLRNNSVKAAVDVLIPVFNAESTVRDAIGSIQTQSISDIRIIVINDGSTDGTLAILEELASSDPRIVILNIPNGGIVQALNAGLKLATADFVARHDGDDIAFSCRLIDQLAFMREHPACPAVGSNARHINSDGELTGEETSFGCPGTADPNAVPSREPYLLHPFMMARRAALLVVGGYRHVIHAEDTDLYWRLQGLGELHNLSDVHGLFRLHPRSITNISIVNGRISALNSQLAAVSEQRRRAGKPDICFEKERLSEYHEAGTLDAMMDLLFGLDMVERQYVVAATAAKLMDAALFRPYELETSDCDFAHKALLRTSWLPRQNRRELEWLIAVTARRLLAKGLYKECWSLLPFRTYPRVLLQSMKRIHRRK